MVLCVKLMGLSVTIHMRVLMILMISHPMILFFPCIHILLDCVLLKLLHCVSDNDFMIL